MPCPKCGSTHAHVFTRDVVVVDELCDLETGELIRQLGAEGTSLPSRTYRIAECARCGHRFRLSNEEHERVRW